MSATPPELVHAGFKYKTNTLKLKQQILIYLIANFQNAGVNPPPSTLTECCCRHLLGKTMQSSTCLFPSAGFNQASFIHYSSSQNMHRSILTISVYLSWVNQLPYKTTNSYVFFNRLSVLKALLHQVLPMVLRVWKKGKAAFLKLHTECCAAQNIYFFFIYQLKEI